jgi:phosphopantothenoylcysteine decarboxylase/phosphopantothenate--cysteine ligase
MQFLITAGPTREPLDPVRYLSNRSSGKMGYALAMAAAAAGHEVTLVSGPTALHAPVGVKLIKVTTAREMYEAVHQVLPFVQVAIFAAAVADYRPVQAAGQKIKKQEQTMTITLERTQDILGSVRSAGFHGVLVGFAAETENLEANAKGKLTRKGCDFIVANDVSRAGTGFDADENEITLFFANGDARALPRAGKADLAQIIVGICGERMVTSRT